MLQMRVSVGVGTGWVRGGYGVGQAMAMGIRGGHLWVRWGRQWPWESEVGISG